MQELRVSSRGAFQLLLDLADEQDVLRLPNRPLHVWSQCNIMRNHNCQRP